MALIELAPNSGFTIPLRKGSLTASALCAAANEVNLRLESASLKTQGQLDVFGIIDLRMLSGLLGELLTTTIANNDVRLVKNPNIDGYPDLCDFSWPTPNLNERDFINFPSGGVEVKNTFGVKKAGVGIGPRETRKGKIRSNLVWKAHHQRTNNLLALQSDYIHGTPQIIAGYFSHDLVPSDWTAKSNPSLNSTMTSFCQTKPSAFQKLLDGMAFSVSGENL